MWVFFWSLIVVWCVCDLWVYGCWWWDWECEMCGEEYLRYGKYRLYCIGCCGMWIVGGEEGGVGGLSVIGVILRLCFFLCCKGFLFCWVFCRVYFLWFCWCGWESVSVLKFFRVFFSVKLIIDWELLEWLCDFFFGGLYVWYK